MTVESVLKNAVTGLQTAERKASQAATEIVEASAGIQTSQASLSSSTRVTSENALITQLEGSSEAKFLNGVVDLIEAEVAYKASAEVIRTAEELSDETVDILS